MIPHDLNDGFTTEVRPGVFTRPMLFSNRAKLRGVESAEVIQRISVDPYLFTNGEKVSRDDGDVWKAILGYSKEKADLNSLADSLSLHMETPGMSLMSCDTCKTVSINHSTGEIYIGADGNPVRLSPAAILPCMTRLGCPKGRPEDNRGLSNQRWAATIRHFWYYRSLPSHRLASCPIWHRNRLLIEWILFYGRDRRFDPFVGGSPG